MNFLFEWNVFRSTVMFLTRIPVGNDLPHDPILLQHTPRYFPLVGYMVGFIHVIIWLLAYALWDHNNLAILLAMLATIWATGAFHEDGFADVCDAFGGGWTKEQIMTIMKDSRLGTYGTVGLIGMLATKFLALCQIPHDFSSLSIHENTFYGRFGLLIAAVLCGHAISRCMAVLVIQTGNYATDNTGSKSKPLASVPMSKGALLFTVCTAFLPFLFLFPAACWMAIFPVMLSTWLFYRFFKKWIGGYTGDCLGSIQQMAEVVFYLSIGLLLKWNIDLPAVLN
jgi:adenosylcobinamide-GDP ribazoletransferase